MATDERDPLAQELVDALIKKKWKITTAESCTGGLIAAELTAVSGTSAVFERGIVSYSNEVKSELLGVNKNTLEKFGAVSREVAMEMAVGARHRAKANIAVSVTGIAGPTGGTARKPVGLVFIGVSTADSSDVERYQLDGDRKQIREQAVRTAIRLTLNTVRRSENTPI